MDQANLFPTGFLTELWTRVHMTSTSYQRARIVIKPGSSEALNGLGGGVRFRAMEGPNACTHVHVAVCANKPQGLIN